MATLGIDAKELANATPRRGAGCNECGGTGYRGRLGVFEVLPVTANMRAVLMSTPNEGAVAAAALAEGMQTLRASAIGKASAGLTTYEEVLRVTQVDSSSGLHCSACGGALASDMVACPWCTAAIDRGHCGGCDRQLEPEWRVCPWCRTPTPPRREDSTSIADGTPRVLLIEDDASVRQFVTASLAGTVEVDAVATAGEGLERVSTSNYDGVIVDQVLPDLTGVEVIRLLRCEARTAVLPVMLFTGHGGQDLEHEARNAGADDYVTKPVDSTMLEERLLALVNRNARAEG
jgi:CheY-like chemotaxis protein